MNSTRFIPSGTLGGGNLTNKRINAGGNEAGLSDLLDDRGPGSRWLHKQNHSQCETDFLLGMFFDFCFLYSSSDAELSRDDSGRISSRKWRRTVTEYRLWHNYLENKNLNWSLRSCERDVLVKIWLPTIVFVQSENENCFYAAIKILWFFQGIWVKFMK